jgi:hypothetical protein
MRYNAAHNPAIASGNNGILGVVGRPCGLGYSADIVVVNVAVHDARVVPLAAAGVHFTGEPRFVLPFANCTVPVGPSAELLVEPMVAVSVTLVPAGNDDKLDETPVVVVALVMITAAVLLFPDE